MPMHQLSPPTCTEVADRVLMVSSGPGAAGSSNAAVLLGDEGATVVDTLLVPSMAQCIHTEIERRNRHADLLVYTHPHADHVGGSSAFPEVRLLADPVTADSVRRLAADPALLPGLFPAFADELTLARPRVPEPIDAGHRLLLAGRGEAFTTGPAHTPVDLAVHVPAAGVLVTGDLCFNQVVPLALPGHADIAGWAAALDRLIALDPNVVVPGHGPAGGIEILYAVRHWLGAVLETAGEAVELGIDARSLLGQVDLGPVAGWAEPGRTVLALAVAAAEISGDPSHLPAGVPVASRTGQPPAPSRA